MPKLSLLVWTFTLLYILLSFYTGCRSTLRRRWPLALRSVWVLCKILRFHLCYMAISAHTRASATAVAIYKSTRLPALASTDFSCEWSADVTQQGDVNSSIQMTRLILPSGPASKAIPSSSPLVYRHCNHYLTLFLADASLAAQATNKGIRATDHTIALELSLLRLEAKAIGPRSSTGRWVFLTSR